MPAARPPIRSRADAETVALRSCAWRIGTDRAAQGFPLDALLHAYRIGCTVVWEQLLETASKEDPLGDQSLVHVAADVWNFVDEHCTLVATAYQEVERQLSWHRENRYRIIVAALLDGTARVSDFPEAEEVLGLPERGRYAVVALEDTDASSRAPHPAAVCAGLRTVWHTAEGTAHAIVLLGIPGSGAVTGCTVFIGSLMVCYAALGGMKGTGFIQILKTVLLLAAFVLLAALVLKRFSWNPFTLFDAAADASGYGDGFWQSGRQYGSSPWWPARSSPPPWRRSPDSPWPPRPPSPMTSWPRSSSRAGSRRTGSWPTPGRPSWSSASWPSSSPS